MQRGTFSAIHFAGLDLGIVVSGAGASAMAAAGAGWRKLRVESGVIAFAATTLVGPLVGKPAP